MGESILTRRGRARFSRLPNGYTEVEYIKATSQSQNANWIQTTVVPTGTMHFIMDFAIHRYQQYQRVMMYGGYFHAECINASNGVIEMKGGSQSATKIADSQDVALNTVTRFEVSADGVYVGGSKVCDLPASSASETACIELNHNSFGQYKDHDGYMIFYFATATDNGVEVLNLVPCIRDSDAAVGMYDLASDTYLANMGSTAFEAGPIV